MTTRWGLIGAGDIANKRVAAAIQADTNSELVAVCRRSGGPLHAFADQFGVPQRFTHADHLIASSGIDAVYIATPVDLHLPQTVAAARAGKHVLVEKPMALDPAECDQMIAACAGARGGAGVSLGVAYYRRFYPVVQRAESLIRLGQLGRILSVACVTGTPIRFPADDWRVVRARGGGGPLMDIGSHRIDLFLQLLGDVAGVKASTIASPDYQAEQAATLVMRFTSGAHGVLHCCFGAVSVPDRLEVIGADGRLTVEDLNRGDLTLHTSEGESHESHPPASNTHAPLIADFTAALRAGRSPTVSGVVGKQTSEVICRAYEDAGARS